MKKVSRLGWILRSGCSRSMAGMLVSGEAYKPRAART